MCSTASIIVNATLKTRLCTVTMAIARS
ncbi:hypothetical protein ANCDUO_24254 [Ancylostoma duodenale]|uniref:Uncharacterized protein n=1 Tax=Ancylostoma duodenale TaxID=51022 RepID=A0A0C2C7R1_9BILA|nr:hypothetical protein ANCDUO_24254 [Ancylostoma duodenale]